MADSVVSIISRYDEGAEYQNFMNTRNINVHFLVAPQTKEKSLVRQELTRLFLFGSPDGCPLEYSALSTDM